MKEAIEKILLEMIAKMTIEDFGRLKSNPKLCGIQPKWINKICSVLSNPKERRKICQ